MKLINQIIGQLDFPAQVLSASGKVVFSNKEFLRLFREPTEEEWDTCENDTVSCCGQNECMVKDELQRALAGEAVSVGSIKVAKPAGYHDGKNISDQLDDGVAMNFNLRPLFDEKGEVFAVISLIYPDTNPDEKYENELLKIQKGENLEILASGVAHEFNNIFTGIKGLTDLIKDEVDQTSDVFEFAQMIQQNITRGAELIQQLSSFARQLPHSLRPRRIAEYIELAIPLLQIQVQRRITLETRILTDGIIQLDKSRMDQALSNIMHNARDAMGSQGKIIVTVDCKSPPEKPDRVLPPNTKWVWIEIADSGPGIPAELISRVIEPFFSTKEQGKATGLGLSVTRRIISSHHGCMEIARSEELGGAAISIYLPLQEQTDAKA